MSTRMILSITAAIPLATGFVLAAAVPGFADDAPAARISRSPSSIARPSTMTTSSKRHSPLATLKVVSRAKALGNKASASGTRYFVVNDRKLRSAKNTQALLRRLAPSAVRGKDRVRRVEVVVDIKRPITVRVVSSKTVRVGTVLLRPDAGPINVNTSVYVSKITVIRKK